jgi:hypothetical protein
VGYGRQARQQQKRHHGVASYRQEQRHQAHQLKPVPRRRRIAARAHRLLRQKVQPASIAEHFCSPTVLEMGFCRPLQTTRSETQKTTGRKCSVTSGQYRNSHFSWCGILPQVRRQVTVNSLFYVSYKPNPRASFGLHVSCAVKRRHLLAAFITLEFNVVQVPLL